MKKTLLSITVAAIALSGAIGCAQLDKALLAPGLPTVEQVETVTPRPVIATNFVTIPGVPEPSLSLVTNFVLVTNTVEVLRTNFVLNPTVQATLETAGAVAAVTPYGPIAAPLLGLASTVLTFYAAQRNRKYKEAAAALASTIRGVEKVAGIIGKDSARQVKESIRTEASLTGAQETLHAAVRKET